MALSAGSAVGQQSLAGKRVVVIHHGAPLAVSGKAVATAEECAVFTVDKVDGVWLWIKSERAYLRRGDVVPMEDSLCHYTRKLETNKTANNYWNLAKIWRLNGELDMALGAMNAAIRLNSNRSSWFITRGILWYDQQEYDKAIADHSEAIRLDPQNGLAYGNRANSWTAKQEFDKAIADHDEALKHNGRNQSIGALGYSEVTGGDSASMVNSRALALNNRGDAWRKKGDYDNAIADYEEAIRLDPKFKNPYTNRRWTWGLKGDWNRAIAELDAAIQAEPKNVQLIMERAGVWGRKPDFEKQFADYEAVTRIDPKYAKAWNGKAWLRATCPDEKHRNGQLAVEYATKACELRAWQDANQLDTLAATYAEAGDFAKAVEWEQKAIDLAPAGKKADYESRLKLYRDNKPFRQTAK